MAALASPAHSSCSLADLLKGPCLSRLMCSACGHVIPWLDTTPHCSAAAPRALRKWVTKIIIPADKRQRTWGLYIPLMGNTCPVWEIAQRICTGFLRAEVSGILLGATSAGRCCCHRCVTAACTQIISPGPQIAQINPNFRNGFAVGLSQRGRCRQGLLSSGAGHSALFAAQSGKPSSFLALCSTVKASPCPSPCMA